VEGLTTPSSRRPAAASEQVQLRPNPMANPYKRDQEFNRKSSEPNSSKRFGMTTIPDRNAEDRRERFRVQRFRRFGHGSLAQ